MIWCKFFAQELVVYRRGQSDADLSRVAVVEATMHSEGVQNLGKV